MNDNVKKLALINPATLPEDAISEPLHLGILAAYIKQKLPGIRVKVLDQATGDDIRAGLAAYAPDYVGVTAATPLVNEAYRILDHCRKQGYRTIIGGAHASTMPDEAKQHADYVVVGEGEKALLSILAEQPPYGILKGGELEDLDALPFVDRSSINMEYYIRHNIKTPVQHYYFLKRKMRIASIITSRGCPIDCIYCYNSWKGARPRYQSAERVFNELADIKKRYNIDVIYFHDDDSFINKPRMLELCDRLEKAKLGLIWSASGRVSSFDKEVLDAAYRAGCRQVFQGIESGSQKILDTLHKRTTVEQAEQSIRLAKEAGLMVYGGFMLGSPGETLGDIKKTKKFIFTHSKYIDTISLCVTTPYPGTALWEHCRKHGLIPGSFDWDKFRFEHGGISANEFFTKEQLLRIRFWFLIELFLTFRIRFSFYYLKYPAYFLLKAGEALLSIMGLKSERTAPLK